MPRADFYRHKHPVPEDVLLLIEVSDSTLRYDLDVKVPLYARHGIAELWVVDLQHGELNLFCQPKQGRYLEHRTTREPGKLAPAALPDIRIDLSELFVD